MTDSASSAGPSLIVLFAGVAGPRQLDGAAMDELERVRGIAGANVADDLRRGRGVRAIIASTSGLSDRFSPRWRGGCWVGKAFFDCILLDPGPDADVERRRGCAPPAGTGGRVFSVCEGVLGCEASEGVRCCVNLLYISPLSVLRAAARAKEYPLADALASLS